MPTFTALTTLEGRDPAYALGEAMERLTPEPTGVGVFEVEDGSGLWEVGGYFEEAPDTAALAVLAKAMGAKEFTVSELPETDWVAHVRRELAPVEAGRFFVYGSHDADKVPEDCEPLLIEAGIIKGRKATSFSSIATDVKNAGAHYEDSEVVADQGIVTSRSPEDLDAFVAKIVEEIEEGKHDRKAA